MFYRWGPYYERDCREAAYLGMVSEIDAYHLKVQAEQRAAYVRSFIRTSPPGTETAEGYRECTHCRRRSPWGSAHVLHAPGCEIGAW